MAIPPFLHPDGSADPFAEGNDPFALGRQGTAILDEAVLRALEDSRPNGYISSILLSQRIGWDTDGMPSPNGDGYGRVAVLGLLYRLYLEGRVEPAHLPNRRGHWGGWRITDEEYARRHGVEAVELTVPEAMEHPVSMLSGWVTLADYPLPPKSGLMPTVPSGIRFSDGTEYEPTRWNDVLSLVVEWLNSGSLLVPGRNVPVRMSRGKGYLVNTEPFHSDGRPMEKRVQAGGPDRLWVHTKSPATPAHYGIYHSRRLMQYCGRSPGNMQLWLGKPGAADDRTDQEHPVWSHLESDAGAEGPVVVGEVTLIPPPWDLPPRQQARWRAVQQARMRGLGMQAIASELGMAPYTVRKYVRASIVKKDEAETDSK